MPTIKFSEDKAFDILKTVGNEINYLLNVKDNIEDIEEFKTRYSAHELHLYKEAMQDTLHYLLNAIIEACENSAIENEEIKHGRA